MGTTVRPAARGSVGTSCSGGRRTSSYGLSIGRRTGVWCSTTTAVPPAPSMSSAGALDETSTALGGGTLRPGASFPPRRETRSARATSTAWSTPSRAAATSVHAYSPPLTSMGFYQSTPRGLVSQPGGDPLGKAHHDRQAHGRRAHGWRVGPEPGGRTLWSRPAPATNGPRHAQAAQLGAPRCAARRHPPGGPTSRVGEIPGALIIERNVLEWRLDPTSPHRHPALTGPDQKLHHLLPSRLRVPAWRLSPFISWDLQTRRTSSGGSRPGRRPACRLPVPQRPAQRLSDTVSPRSGCSDRYRPHPSPRRK